MDFTEIESIEALRWSWNSWPSSKSEAAELVVPTAVLHTPLLRLPDLPLLPYDPLLCSSCTAALNPFARVDYRRSLWSCPLCRSPNPFPRSYAGIGADNLPAELFPTHSTVEYLLPSKNPNPNPSSAPSPSFVFVVDVCTEEEEMGELRREIALVLAQLPENTLVGLVSFGEMVWVHDLGFADCSRVIVFAGDRELGSDKIIELLGIHHLPNHKFGMSQPQCAHRQGFLLPVSACEFSITTALEELVTSPRASPGCRLQRATGAAISTAIALLEGWSPNYGGRVMVFTSGPATTGPGMIVEADLSKPIRTHRDIVSYQTPLSEKAKIFYKKLAQRLSERSLVLDLFACSLDQVGAYELRLPIEASGGFMILAESFKSDQFKSCLRLIFKHERDNHLNMNFEANVKIVTTKDVKICGALGPCMSLRLKNGSVSEKEIGQGGTHSWKLSTVTNKTCVAYLFQVDSDRNVDQGPVFFIQFMTWYRHGNGGYRLRVTTAARRWATTRSAEISSGFDQEAAAVIVARLAVHRVEQYHTRDVIRWLEKMLVRFTAKFGDYMPEDPSSFQLSSNFSLYPQFMYYLRRSQFVDVFNSTPDETAFMRLTLNREGVMGSLVMIQPTLFQYSFDGPPVPVLLDISSVSPDVILLFDSYFHVVIHYGAKIAQWRKMGLDKDPNHESLRKLMEAPEIDAQALVDERIPVPKLIRCDQHGSQARFLLARMNPSTTQKNWSGSGGSEVIFTDDVSLQAFIEDLQALAVRR